MAVDTEAKRKSMLNYSSPNPGILVFLQGGGVSTGDRATLLHIYEGNALDPPVPITDSSLSIAATPARSIVRKIASKVTDIYGDEP